MKGLVLAAGLGSRLYPVTKAVAKPLLPIANRMTLEYAFDQFRECGIHDVCVVVGEKNEEQIQSALGDGSAFGLNLSFVKQSSPQGLAHAVGFAREFMGVDPFLLYLGDAIYGESLKPLVDKFLSTGAANVNLVKAVEDPRRFGVATVAEDGKIVKLVEKPPAPESNLAMAGTYVFGPQIWPVIERLQPSARGEYEITDAIQLLVDNGEPVYAHEYFGEWFDTGTLDSFLETTRYLTGGKPLVAETAVVDAELGENVVIGDYARVTAGRLENVVVLPQAVVEVQGNLDRCLLGGILQLTKGIQGEIRFGNLD